MVFLKYENGNDVDNIFLLVIFFENGYISIYIFEKNVYINKILIKGENIIGLDFYFIVDNL